MENECIICLDENDLLNIECKSCHGINIHENCFIELLNNNGDKCPHCRGDLIIPDREPFISVFSEDIDQILFRNRYITIRECHRLKAVFVVSFFMMLSYICGYCITILGCLFFFDKCSIDVTLPFTNQYYFFLRVIIGVVFLIAISGPTNRRFHRRRNNNAIIQNNDRNALV